jgi:spermidine/putrescine transport system substrate-binding protein
MFKIFNSVGFTIFLLATVVASVYFFFNPLILNDITITPDVIVSGDERADTLFVYSFPNYFSEKVLQEFKDAENIAIKIDFYDSNEELLETMFDGKPYDVIVPTDYMIKELRALNLIEPIQKQLIPNYKNIDIRFREMEYDYGNQYSIPYFWGAVGLTYDQNHVMNLPLTWSSLLDTIQVAHLRNKIAILDDARMSLGIILIAMGLDPNTRNEDDISQAADILIHLSPYIGLIQSEDLVEPLMNGDIHMAMNWSGSSAYIADINTDFRFVLPAEGSIFFVDNFAVPVNAPSRTLAYKFINYLLDPRVAANLTNENFFPNPITASRRFVDRIILKGPAYINPFLASNVHVIEDLGEVDSIYYREWQRFRDHIAQINNTSVQTEKDRGRIRLF